MRAVHHLGGNGCAGRVMQKRAPKTSFTFISKVPNGIAHKVKSAIKTQVHYKLLKRATKNCISLGIFVWLFICDRISYNPG